MPLSSQHILREDLEPVFLFTKASVLLAIGRLELGELASQDGLIESQSKAARDKRQEAYKPQHYVNRSLLC